MLTVIPVLILIRWNCKLLAKSGKQTVSFRNPNTWQNCCNGEKNKPGCFPGRCHLQLSSYHRLEYCFYHQAPIPRLTNKNVYQQFQSCVNTHWRHNIPFYVKRGQGRMFYDCCLPELFLAGLDETVFSDDFLARSGRQSVSFKKQNTRPKFLLYCGEKWTRVFFWKVWGC